VERLGEVIMPTESYPVKLARTSLQYYYQHNCIMPVPGDVPANFMVRAGVFVSLKKKGALRGCIGTFLPVQENVAMEIIINAISAAMEDPRFCPVDAEELPELTISVDVLGTPEQVHSEAELDPARYGIIVSNGTCRGLLLPMLDGVDTVAQQIAITRQKAGIGFDEPLEIYRFTVTRYN